MIFALKEQSLVYTKISSLKRNHLQKTKITTKNQTPNIVTHIKIHSSEIKSFKSMPIEVFNFHNTIDKHFNKIGGLLGPLSHLCLIQRI